ncbi:MAG: transketolase [Planctomycetota bacterium]|jgi:transketolase
MSEFSPPDFAALEQQAARLRCDVVRMIANAGSGHNGGALSAADVIAYLYFHRLRIDPERPHWPGRDRFVLSKGHCCPILYAALAARGFFPHETLWTLRDVGSRLQGHPDMTKTPGVDMTTGSLGQGISAAVGIALGGKLDGRDYRVYCMVGDGEIQEGQVWEAAMAAAHHHLANLTVLVDNNKMETDGETRSIINVEPIEDRWRAFGWAAERVDGHKMRQIHEGLQRLDSAGHYPRVLVADTVKGKGVSFMEGQAEWHSGPTSEGQTRQALEELSALTGPPEQGKQRHA